MALGKCVQGFGRLMRSMEVLDSCICLFEDSKHLCYLAVEISLTSLLGTWISMLSFNYWTHQSQKRTSDICKLVALLKFSCIYRVVGFNQDQSQLYQPILDTQVRATESVVLRLTYGTPSMSLITSFLSDMSCWKSMLQNFRGRG